MKHSKMLTKLYLFFAVALLFAFLILSFYSWEISAQQETSASSNSNTTSTPTASPTPIPFSSIIREAEITTKKLAEIKQKFSEQSSVSQLQTGLSQLENDINIREQNTNELLNSPSSLDSLDKDESFWSSQLLTIPTQKSNFQTQAETMAALLAELQNIQLVWNLTKKSLEDNADKTQNNNLTTDQLKTDNSNTSPVNNQKKADKQKQSNNNVSVNSTKTSNSNSLTETNRENPSLPDDFKIKIDEIIETAKNLEIDIQANLANLIKLQNQLAEIEKRTNAIVLRISSARSDLLSNLVIKDSPPIWSAESFNSSFRLDAERSFSEKIGLIKNYIAGNPLNLLFHFLVILTLVLIFRQIRRKTQYLIEEEPELKTGLIIFEYPICSALILGFFLAPFYLQSAELLAVVGSPVLVISIFIIFRQFVSEKMIPILIAIVSLYLLNEFRLLTASVPFLSRLIFLVQLLGGITFLLWVLRKKFEAEDSTSSKYSLRIRSVVVFLLILFTFAFFANILGYVGLSGLIGRAIVISLSLGLILYAIVQVIGSLLLFVFRIPPFSKLRMVKSSRKLVQSKLFNLFKWIAITIWFFASLTQVYLLNPLLKLLEQILIFEFKIGAVSISLGNILFFIFIVWFSFLLSRFIRFVLEEDVYPRVRMANGLPYATSTILHYLILLGGVFLAMAGMGIDLTKFTVFLGALGVGVGIGLQNIVENFTSGLILLLERPIKVGDSIQINQYQGELKKIGLRASIVKTFDGAEIIVPNGQLITHEVTNWTLSDYKRRIEINIGVGHDSDPEKVIEILEEVGKNHPEIDLDSTPKAIFVEFTDKSLNFQLRVWTVNHSKWVFIKSDLSVSIYKALKDANIKIPSAQTDLHLNSEDKQLLAVLSETRNKKDKNDIDKTQY